MCANVCNCVQMCAVCYGQKSCVLVIFQVCNQVWSVKCAMAPHCTLHTLLHTCVHTLGHTLLHTSAHTSAHLHTCVQVCKCVCYDNCTHCFQLPMSVLNARFVELISFLNAVSIFIDRFSLGEKENQSNFISDKILFDDLGFQPLKFWIISLKM